MPDPRPPISRRRCLQTLAALPLLGLVPGCQLVGAIASKIPEPPVDAAYKGLVGQPIAIMAWADEGVVIDWPTIVLDTANALQAKLQQASVEAEELAGISFPYRPESVVRWQRENPDWPAQPITAIAPRFRQITRLIYVEYESFSTRSAASLDLFRGSASITLRVVEVADGKATIAYEENYIRTAFPRNAPEDGVPSGTDLKMYVGTVDAITLEAAKRFMKHSSDA